MAPRGGRLGPHADGDGPGAHAHRRPASPEARGRDARGALPRSRQAADDRVQRRADPVDRSRTGRRRAGACPAGSAERPHHRRVRRARARSRASSRITSSRWRSSSRRRRSGDGAFRRLAQKVDLELLARVAESDCLGRGGAFDCSGIGWFSSVRARSASNTRRPPPLVMGRHLLALGVTPGPRHGGAAARDLRAAARWAGSEPGRRDRAGAGRCCASDAGAAVEHRDDRRRTNDPSACAVFSWRCWLRCAAPAATAQSREPIGLFVADARVALPATSRIPTVAAALGVDTARPSEPRPRAGVRRHTSIRCDKGSITFGLGAELMTSGRSRSPEDATAAGTTDADGAHAASRRSRRRSR